MKRKRSPTLAGGLAPGLSFGNAAVADSHDMARSKAMFETIPAINPIPADSKQTPVKIELGKMLFLSGDVCRWTATWPVTSRR